MCENYTVLAYDVGVGLAEVGCSTICCTSHHAIYLKECYERCKDYFLHCRCPTEPPTSPPVNITSAQLEQSHDADTMVTVLVTTATMLLGVVAVLLFVWWKTHKPTQCLRHSHNHESSPFLECGRTLPEYDASIRARPAGGCLLADKRASLMRDVPKSLPVMDGMLDDLDQCGWCKAYMVQDGHVEIHQGYGIKLTLEKEHLQDIQPGMIKQYLPSEYITKPANQYAPHPSCIFISCGQQLYAITVASTAASLSKDIGESLLKLEDKANGVSYNIAVLKVNDGVDIDSYCAIPTNVKKITVANEKEVANKECWKVHFWRGSGICGYAYIKHSVYTNKKHNVHRMVTLMKQTEEDVMLDDVIGSLVTSSVSGAGHMTIYGVLIGRLTQSKGEFVEFYVVAPLYVILNAIQDLDEFRGKDVELYQRKVKC